MLDSLRHSQTNQEVLSNVSGPAKGVHMKLMLTGISQETHFSPPSSLLYLVFNNGDLKVPVTTENGRSGIVNRGGNISAGDAGELGLGPQPTLNVPFHLSLPRLYPFPRACYLTTDHDVALTHSGWGAILV